MMTKKKTMIVNLCTSENNPPFTFHGYNPYLDFKKYNPIGNVFSAKSVPEVTLHILELCKWPTTSKKSDVLTSNTRLWNKIKWL